MLHYLRLYGLLQMANLRSRARYRLNFFIGIFGVACVGIGNYVVIWVITRQVPQVYGWNLEQLVFLGAIFQITHGLFIVTFQQIRQIEYVLREGLFDRFLVRPLNPLFQYSTSSITFAGFGDMSSGCIGIAFALSRMEGWVNAEKVTLLILFVICGATIQWALYTIIGCTAFWTLQGQGLRDILNPFLFQFNQFPLTVYNRGVQVILTFFLGISFIGYYPSVMFFDKSAEVPFSSGLVYFPPIVAVVLVTFAYQLWQRGLKVYKGAGS